MTEVKISKDEWGIQVSIGENPAIEIRDEEELYALEEAIKNYRQRNDVVIPFDVTNLGVCGHAKPWGLYSSEMASGSKTVGEKTYFWSFTSIGCEHCDAEVEKRVDQWIKENHENI